ncbi:hypothetical protein MNB_SV-14-1467 [hydrothermal vent metagenome]|uniref:Outer membrane protein beta-barrel domain-containing protein n=1 Tax=hydrothermal vent metagenome TaxID=652676 RepID=A0A1W1CVV4_9ZZZZ
MLKKIPLLTFLTFSFINASNTLNPILQIGYDFGGTTLATVEHDGYYDSSINKVRAGQGLSFEAGAVVDSPDLELQFLVGYRFDNESASNGDVTWDVIPFTAIAMFKSYRWKFGGGLTYHLNPSLEGSFIGYDRDGDYFHDKADDEYENAIGGVAQMQYRVTDNFSVGLKGTFIEYKLKSDNSLTAKGNSIGVNFSYIFGERSEFR